MGNRHYRRKLPNFFFAISRWIIHFWIICAQLFFLQKITLTFALNTCNISIILLFNQKKSQVFTVQCKCLGKFFEKKISWGQIIQKCIIQREMAKNNSSADGGFAAVSSEFLNKHHKSNYYTKAHCCYSYFGWVPALFLIVWKSGNAPPPF